MTTTTTNFVYDKSRRLTTQHSTAEAHYYSYNQRNMVTQIQNVKSVSPDANRYFTYNALGERVYGVDGTATPSYWAYDGGKMLSESVAGTTARYQHNDTAQDCFGSVVEHLSALDFTRCYPVFKEDGSVIQMKGGAVADKFESSRFGVVMGSAIGIPSIPPSHRLQVMTHSFQSLTAVSQQTHLAQGGGVLLANQAIFAGGMAGPQFNPAAWLVGCGAGIGLGGGQPASFCAPKSIQLFSAPTEDYQIANPQKLTAVKQKQAAAGKPANFGRQDQPNSISYFYLIVVTLMPGSTKSLCTYRQWVKSFEAERTTRPDGTRPWVGKRAIGQPGGVIPNIPSEATNENPNGLPPNQQFRNDHPNPPTDTEPGYELDYKIAPWGPGEFPCEWPISPEGTHLTAAPAKSHLVPTDGNAIAWTDQPGLYANPGPLPKGIRMEADFKVIAEGTAGRGKVTATWHLSLVYDDSGSYYGGVSGFTSA